MAAWVIPAITAAGSLISSMANRGGGGGGGMDYHTPEVAEYTKSGNTWSDQQFIFNQEITDAYQALGDLFTQWAGQDRESFNQFMDWQNDMTRQNMQLVGQIGEVAGESTTQLLRNMMANSEIKSLLERNVRQGGEGVQAGTQVISDYLKNMPSEEEAIGQALADVEQEFGKAGQELARKMASQGKGLSQATMRSLGIEKAKARAGAAAQAKAERLNTATQLTQGLAQLQQAQQGQLTAAQQQDLAQGRGAFDLQFKDIMEQKGVGEAGQFGADIYKTLAERLEASRQGVKSFDTQRRNNVQPYFLDPDTGKIVYGTGEEVGMPLDKNQIDSIIGQLRDRGLFRQPTGGVGGVQGYPGYRAEGDVDFGGDPMGNAAGATAYGGMTGLDAISGVLGLMGLPGLADLGVADADGSAAGSTSGEAGGAGNIGSV